jgi:hypothetical protein
MSKKEEVLTKYKTLLDLVYQYCKNEEAFTSKHLTRALKINDRAIIVMRNEGIITKLSNGRKKLYRWNLEGGVTESVVNDFYESVKDDQREWLLKQKSLKMDNQRTLVFFEDNKPKQRRKISILWGLITF